MFWSHMTLGDMRGMEEKCNGFESMPPKYCCHILGPQVEPVDESSIVTVLDDMFGYRLI